MGTVYASDLTSWYNRINGIRNKTNINLGDISVPSVQNIKATKEHYNNVVSAINSLYSNTYLSFADQTSALSTVSSGDLMKLLQITNINTRLDSLEKICGNCTTTSNSTQGTCATQTTCTTNSTKSTNSTFSFSTFSDDGHRDKFTFGTNVVYGTASSNFYGQKTLAAFATFNTEFTFGGDATNSTKATNSTFTFTTNTDKTTTNSTLTNKTNTVVTS